MARQTGTATMLGKKTTSPNTFSMGLFDKLKGATEFFRSGGELLREIGDCFLRKDCLPLARRLLRLYKERGRMIRLSVDSENKQIEVEVLLKGQHEPLRVTASNYQTLQEDSAHFIVVSEVETSWPWVNVALKTFGGAEKKLRLPDQYAELILLAL